MKERIISILQFLFGYQRYLKIFSIAKIATLRLDKRKSDYLFFTKLLSKNANILIIGACTGITTIPFAKNYSNRKVIAYEPQSINYLVLNKIIKWFKLTNIITFNIGMSNKPEYRKIILPLVNGAKKQGMAHITGDSISNNNVGISETVYLDCADNRPELLNIKIEGIKVVAENFELQIFEGARVLIEKNKPIIYCELWDNEKRDLVLELILSYGYLIYYRNKNEILSYNPHNYSGKNFIFKPING